MEFISRILKAITRLQLPAGARILTGVSGGIDSMVLLHALHKTGYPVSAAHVNFKLRGEESDEDEQQVRTWCAANGIPCLVLEADTNTFAAQHHLNIQQAARTIRYQWWEELIQKGEFDYIATAHHEDDHVETILMNFLRGTGIKGLTGIPAKRGHIIRPLLYVSRIDIEQYAADNNLPFRNDSSNDKDHYLRNNIRHHLLPLLEKMLPGIKERILHTSKRSTLEWGSWEHIYQAWQQSSIARTNEGYALTMRQGEASFVLRWLESQGLPWSLGHDYIMAERTTGEPLYYMDRELSRTKDGFFFKKLAAPHHPVQIHSAGLISGPGFTLEISRLPVSEFKTSQLGEKSASTEYVSVDCIQFPLTLRLVQPGDSFQPLGMQGKSKKLQDVFVDHKMAMHEKQGVWVLTNSDYIIWVMGIHLDERAKVKPDDKEVYRLSWKRY